MPFWHHAVAFCSGIMVAGHAASAEIYSDSGIGGPPYASIMAQLQTIQIAHPRATRLVTYGNSVRGEALRLLRIQRPGFNRTLPRPAVLITGATHGNEYLNIADRLPKEFLTRQHTLPGLQSYLAAGGVIYLLPILNPDGYKRDQRENANGMDLNRDFPLIPAGKQGFAQPETKALAAYLVSDLVATNLMLKVSVDYHCCIGALLYPWSYTNSSIPSAHLHAHRRIAHKMVDIFGTSYSHGTTGDILGYRPVGTSKDYYYPRFGALTYTFEGKYRLERNNLEKHVLWWDWILGDLVADQLAAN